jgi:hypothetical protein
MTSSRRYEYHLARALAVAGRTKAHRGCIPAPLSPRASLYAKHLAIPPLGVGYRAGGDVWIDHGMIRIVFLSLDLCMPSCRVSLLLSLN